VLRQVAEGVLVHESEFVQSNAVVVHGPSGVLLIDPGIRADELDDLAHDLVGLGRPVLAGFSTHPHWDHMLWRDSFGEVPRYATALGASTARDRLARGIEVVAKAVGIPEGVPLELLGDIAGLPDGASEVPWDGPRARIVEHRAHAPGHAALVIEKPRVLVSGDMLSDVLVPMLDLDGTVDPIGDYLAALRVFDELAGDVDVVIPGHGSVGDARQLRERIDQDRAYVEALREGREPGDERSGPSAKPGWDWVAGVHDRQVERLADFRGPDRIRS
jgi:glyoxylase-like metal-dependent hydrolase (beta-lactamase superfamily II)